MLKSSYTASKTRSNRPGWSVIFSHPCRTDNRGKRGLKIRKGLGTQDSVEADRLVDQLNELLADEAWWSLDRRREASRQYDEVVVSAFFDGIEVGKEDSWERREEFIPLPSTDEGYARVMLVGTTGAGKTTLLRQLIGSVKDRFPSTSTAKTTTADTEIVTDDEGFEAVVTFMTEHEVRCSVEECLEEACMNVIQDQCDTDIAGALLEHREQRFRLFYILGAWPTEPGNGEEGDSTDLDNLYEDADYDEATTEAHLAESEFIQSEERLENIKCLIGYVERIKNIAMSVRDGMPVEIQKYEKLTNANQRRDWMEAFVDVLYDNREFADLVHDIMDAISQRFALIDVGEFNHGTHWPTLWYYQEGDRDTFLRQVRWFSSNHDQQFGRLLTPLVDGIRVRGPFYPCLPDSKRQLVFLDGEGLGHSAREARSHSVSTRITEKFADVDMILLVDSSKSPMQAAPLELLRSVGSSGHSDKLGIVFTHFDQVKGDNLGTYKQKRNHVRASIGNAIGSLRDSLGAPVTEMLDRQLTQNDYYLGYLDQVAPRFQKALSHPQYGLVPLLECMQKFAVPTAKSKTAPIYSISRLELALRDAADGFKKPWRVRLGLEQHEDDTKEHWGRIKALARRIYQGTDNNEYNELRPKADMISHLQVCISRWLDQPTGWTISANARQQQAAVSAIRQSVFAALHQLVEQRLILDARYRGDWLRAYGFRGTGSSFDRAKLINQIYEGAAPSVSSAMYGPAQEFFDQVLSVVTNTVEEAGGTVEGVQRDTS